MLKRTLAGVTAVEMEMGNELGGGIEIAPEGLAPTLMDESEEVEDDVVDPDAIHSCEPGWAPKRLLLDRLGGNALALLLLLLTGPEADEGEVEEAVSLSPSLDMASSPLSNEVASVDESEPWRRRRRLTELEALKGEDENTPESRRWGVGGVGAGCTPANEPKWAGNGAVLEPELELLETRECR